MKELLDLLVKQIIDESSFKIEESYEAGVVILKLNVNDAEKGKIIGRHGKVIKALRNLLKIRAAKEGKKVYLQLL